MISRNAKKPLRFNIKRFRVNVASKWNSRVTHRRNERRTTKVFSSRPRITCSETNKYDLVWCTVVLVKTDGSVKEYTVKSSSLENELGETVSDKDLFYGNKLIWKYRGCPYDIKICGTHSELIHTFRNE